LLTGKPPTVVEAPPVLGSDVLALTWNNTIYTFRPCNVFWNDPDTVLEEYYHVVFRWRPWLVTVPAYLWESAKAWWRGGDGYWDNINEIEAKNYVNANKKRFRECCGL
jgi:hypothetical protein